MANRLLLVLAAASMLGACSIWATQEEQDAYRQAHPQAVRHAAAPAPAPVAAAPPPTLVTAPPAESGPPPNTVAANVAAPAPSAPARAADNGEIVVPSVAPHQLPTLPNGDPRSAMERAADVRSWDQCVMRLQNIREDNPMRPTLDSPEDICRQRLGMDSRNAVPDSRKPHS